MMCVHLDPMYNGRISNGLASITVFIMQIIDLLDSLELGSEET